MDFKFLQNLKFSIINFSLSPENELNLPFFRGATIRGALGYAFKKNICIKKEIVCKECNLIQDCVYIKLFEPKIKNKNEKVEEIPRPYVIEFPNERKNLYKTGEKFQFNLILFGEAIQYFPYFFLSFIELGKTGLGKYREKFYIESVFQKYPTEKNIFKIGNEFMEKIEEKNFEIECKDIKSIKIKFITPTKIKNEGRFIQVPEFSVFIKAILRRVSQILYFWCDYKEKNNFSEILEDAEKVKIGRCSLKWIDYKRYSTRQKTTMKMGGILGEIEYRGNIGKFYPLISAGSYIHIGKNTSFGLGKYLIFSPD
ncbi:MAG: CRISPR system precrRNA processing endoribonuclease RAMP protein Cas6 [bacterium]|nr:CRISPR system precrRNA processing endoribonuclease RAMP protein Cas6 [bacterium]MDW8164199.1 CRISPR system precrRNA processing endoribonuclease RAMP protein Cas6 [Candidatus Omnitrophota bacterium]